MAKVQNMAIYGQQNSASSYALLDVKITDGEATSVTATKDGKMVRLSKNNILPNGYTQLEYIQSSGTQYINTGYSTTGIGIKTETKSQLTAVSTAEVAIVGRASSSGYEVCFYENNIIELFNDGIRNKVTQTYLTNQDYLIIGELTNNKSSITINGTTTAITGTTIAGTTANMTLFRHNGQYHISAKLYYAKIWDNNILVRDMIPAKRNSDSVLGMYDIVNNVFYTNAGTGTFIAGPELGWIALITSYGTWTVTATDGSRTETTTVNITSMQDYHVTINFPDQYTELEYITSSGEEWTGAYIDTGYQPVSSCRLFGKVQLLRTSGYPRFFIAEKYDSPKAAIATNVVNNKLAYYNGANYSDSSTVSDGNVISVSTGVDYSYSTSGRSITVNGTTKSITNGSAVTSPVVNMYIAWPGTKTYYFQMTNSDGSTLVRDMVPARRNSDGVAGMYDKINGVFYSSANSAVFTAGPAVS